MDYSKYADPEKRKRVLIVDDSATSRLALTNILSMVMDCDVAGDGEDGMKAFTIAWEHGQPYNLICLDIMMPRVDGIQLIKMIRRLENGMGVMKENAVKIVMITAVKNPRFVFDALHHGGADAYIYKPISKDKILAELNKMKLL